MKLLLPLVVAGSLCLAGCVEHETVVRGGPGPYGPPPGPAGPPPLVVETAGVAPYPGAFWVRGHWAFRRGRFGNGRWVWIHGHWR